MRRITLIPFANVALRKESVDRNIGASYGRTAKMVALRKESVDRNGEIRYSHAGKLLKSLSARRAWIEIMSGLLLRRSIKMSLSARRAWIEIFWYSSRIMMLVSLSARRAWIEILLMRFTPFLQIVALRKESVDRNHHGGNRAEHFIRSLSARRAWIEINHVLAVPWLIYGRSPQGERG